MIEISEDRFVALAEQAYARVPAELVAMLDNVVLFVEDRPPADDPDLLGLYDGVPLTERDSHYGGAMPDRIMLFREPLVQMCETEDELIDEVEITVVHEIAHHFGIDDERLHELGYG